MTAKNAARYEYDPAYDYDADLEAADSALYDAYVALKAAREEYNAAYSAARTPRTT